MKHRKLLISFITMLLLVFSFALFSNTAEAAKNYKRLEERTVYKTKLTGSKQYKVKYTYNIDTMKFKLFINGKCVKTLNDTWWPEVNLLKVKSNRNLIYIHDCGPSEDTGYIKVYEYKNDKLKLLRDLATISQEKYSRHLSFANLKSVISEKITIKWSIQSNALGSSFNVDIPYKIGTSKITRSGTSYKLKDWDGNQVKFTANRKIKTYTKAGGDKLAFTVKKGQKVTIMRLYGKNGKTYIQVKNSNGKVGWFRDPDNYVEGGYFKECLFAG